MKERYKWPFYGIGLGLVTSMLSRFMMFRQSGMEISLKQMIGNPLSIWTRTLAPVVLGIVFFYIGLSRDKLNRQKQDTEDKNKELQKAMLEQSMQLGNELNKTMDELNRYTDQLGKIVSSIDEGICLVDREYRIEEGFNESLIRIFGNKDYLGNSVFNTVFSMVEDDKKKEMMEFLDLCFTNASASNSMLSDANPLSEFDYLYIDKGTAVPKSITSRIIRLKDSEGNIDKVLFIFNDVTVERDLERSIEKKEVEFNRKYRIVVSLLGNDSEITKRFIQDLNSNLENLGNRIKALKQNENNRNSISDIIDIIHSIKGEAFSLDFKELADTAAEFEKFLKEKRNSVLDLEMNLEIINHYEKLSNEHAAFKQIIEDLTDFIYGDSGESKKSSKLSIKESVDKLLSSGKETVSLSLLEKELSLVAEKTAEERGKKAAVEFSSGVESLDSERYRYLKDVLIHLIRNSIDHGIEQPEERIKAGKNEEGVIKISVKESDGSLELEYSDDGKGFDVEKIRQKAIAEGIVDAVAIDEMNKMDIIKLVFKDGFSTKDSADMISGIGSGMAVVKKNVLNRLKGKLSLNNKAGRGITVKIKVPL